VLLAQSLARCGDPAAAGRLLREVAPRVPAELRGSHAAASVTAALADDPEVACALAEYSGAGAPDADPRLAAGYGLALLAAGRPGWEPVLRRALASSAGDAAAELRIGAALVAGLREACRTAEAGALAERFVERCAAQGAYGWQVRFQAEALWAALHLSGVADPVIRQAAALLDRAGPADARQLLAATLGLAHADAGAGTAAHRALAQAPGRLGQWVAAEAAWLAGRPAEAADLAAALAPGTATDLAADLAALTSAWATAEAGRPAADPPGSGRPAVAVTLAAWGSGDFAGAARAWEGALLRERVRCLLAGGGQDALLEAERGAEAAGLTVLLGRVRRALRALGVVRRTPGPAVAGLSPRESEVLRLVGQGLPSHRIAELLGISRYTAEGYIKQAMGRLGARTRTEAAVRAAELER
jgi:DNA-binding CsgD family transcriptional regulator